MHKFLVVVSENGSRGRCFGCGKVDVIHTQYTIRNVETGIIKKVHLNWCLECADRSSFLKGSVLMQNGIPWDTPFMFLRC